MKSHKMFFFLLLFGYQNSICQSKTNIYLFPGQGSDHRLFDSLLLSTAYAVKHVVYNTPEKGASIKEFSKTLIDQIDTTQNFIFIGVSLGGMISSELNEILKPQKVIIISSAKNRSELPNRYKFQKVIPIYKIIPAKILLLGAKILQPIVEPDRKLNKSTFKAMLANKEALYIKRTIEMIINWDKKENQTQIIHIHGSNDHTLPIKNIKYSYLIKNGSHMMTLTMYKEINKILNNIL